MKTSIKLLLGLLLLIMAGLFYTKYDLKGRYNALDKSDPYSGFEKIEDLNFQHIRIAGGNRSHLYIEPSEKDGILFKEGVKEMVDYAVNGDTLIITFNESYTDSQNSGTNYWSQRDRSSVIIHYTSIESIIARDASIGLELNTQATFKSELFGTSNLELFTSEVALKELNIESHNNSKHRINSHLGINNLVVLNMALYDQSLAEMYRISYDSSAIMLDSNSRISADATFFKK